MPVVAGKRSIPSSRGVQKRQTSWPLEALLRKRTTLGRGHIRGRQEGWRLEGVRQRWCAQAKQGLQGEAVKRARESLEANTVFQLDMVAGLRQVKKYREIRKRFGCCRFGARPNDYRV